MNKKRIEGPIIVTGGFGFIGSNLIKTLNEKEYTDIIVVEDLGNVSNGACQNISDLEFYTVCDIHDFDFCDCGGASIFHLGADSSTSINFLRAINWNYYWDKKFTDGEYGRAKKIVFASSASVYGNSTTNAIKPQNPYAVAKRLSEQYVLLGNNNVVARLFNVYGPREFHKGKMMSFQSRLLKSFMSSVNWSVMYYKNNALRDFVYVTDVTEALVNLMEMETAPKICDLGTGSPRSFGEVLRLSELQAEVYGGKLNIDEQPWRNAPINTSQYQMYSKAFPPDWAKFRPLEEGIKALWQYYDPVLKTEL